MEEDISYDILNPAKIGTNYMTLKKIKLFKNCLLIKTMMLPINVL